MDLKLLNHALRASRSKDTAFPDEATKRNKQIRSIWQSAVTSLIVNEYLWWTIKRAIVSSHNISHYRNEIENIDLDFTKKQFGEENIILKGTKDVVPKILLENTNTKERYLILKSRVEDFFNKLNTINDKSNACNLCRNNVIKFNHQNISFGENCEVLLVGEAPAKNWWIVSWKAFFDKNNKIVPSWKVLEKLLNIIWLNINEITFIESIKCLPTERKHVNQCWKNCRDILLSQIDILKPNIILPLWESATKNILGEKYTYKTYKEVVWKEISLKIKWGDYLIIPIYHPSPISPVSYIGNISIFERIQQKYGNNIK